MSVPSAPPGGDAQDIPVGMLQAAMSEAHLVLHGPPDFPLNAEILSVCGVSTDNADQNKYGWMVADFLNWKMLFQKRPTQTWLSSLDIAEFLASVTGLDMTNDGTIDTVVGDHNDGILTISGDNEGFEATFLQRLAASACSAVSRKTILVVMVFAPITPEQDICVDFGKKTYLTAERLRDTINDAIGDAPLPVMLMTPSPFTAGWLCRPSFMGRPVHPTPDKMMRTIARSCGGASADRFIKSFTKRKTPLMTDAQRQKVKYDDPMPLNPTELQTNCYHKFQRLIHETLEQRFSIFARDHAFILEPEAARDPSTFSDAWMEYGPRRGRSLEFWAGRLRSSRPTFTDSVNRFEFLGEAFGGTRDSQLFHLKYLSAIELDTCPGDWTRHVGGIAHDLYTGLGERLMVSEDEAKQVFDTIEFRASSMILAHMIAKAFNLPLPDGVKGRYWHDRNYGVGEDYYLKLQAAFGETTNLFDEVAVPPSENRHGYKNVRFARAARWLSAALALRFEDWSKEEIKKFVVEDIARFIAKVRNTQKVLLVEDGAINRAGLDWIAAIGLGEVQIAAPGAAGPEVKTARKPSALDAQAAPWPINAGDTESAKKSSVAAAEAESSLTQSDMHHAVKDLLEDFGTVPANNNNTNGTQNLAPAAVIHCPESKTEVSGTEPLVTGNGPLDATTDPRSQGAANTGSPVNRIGESDASLSANGNASHQETPANVVATPNNMDKPVAAPPISRVRPRTWSEILRPSTSKRAQATPATMAAKSNGADDNVATPPVATPSVAEDRASTRDQVPDTSSAPNHEQEKPDNMAATSNGMDGNVTVSSIANDRASTGNQVLDTSSAPNREQEKPASLTVTPDDADVKAAASPTANHGVNTWDQTPNSSSAVNREQEKPVNMAATSSGTNGTVNTSNIPKQRLRTWSQILYPSSAPKVKIPAAAPETTVGESGSSSTTTTTVPSSVTTAAVAPAPTPPVAPSTTESASPSTTEADVPPMTVAAAPVTIAAVAPAPIPVVAPSTTEVAVPSTTVAAAQPSTQHAFELFAQGMLAQTPNRALDVDATYMAQVLKRAMELVKEDQVAAASASEVETPAADTAPSSVHANGNANETSGVSTERPGSDWAPTATSQGPVQGAGVAKEKVRIPTETPATLPPATLGASRHATTGHARVDSLNHKMESLTIHDSVAPPRPAVARQGANTGPMQGAGNAGTAQPATAPGTAGASRNTTRRGAQLNLVADEDFFASAGIKW